MPLGLDLRGGLYLLYQVDLQGAVSQLLESYEQSFRRALNEAKLPFTDITTITSGSGGIANGAARDACRRTPIPPAIEAALKKVDPESEAHQQQRLRAGASTWC